MPVIFRKLLPDEFGGYQDHLVRLSGRDRVSRFHAGTADESIERHCQRLRWPETRLIGCFIDGVLRGAVELQSFQRPGAAIGAELAVSVEDAYQGHGIGTELVRRALLVARNRWIRGVGMLSLANNFRMREIGRRYGGRSNLDDGSIETVYRLSRPDARSFAEEMADDGVALVFLGLNRWQRSIRTPRHDMPAFAAMRPATAMAGTGVAAFGA
ncbi:MAG: GNAT family N-acetyltransferase [Rhodospirillaceae bacterium]|nr:GNAT family N-acetyltransferase [Rhodospirillaceae bacterium]